jgi:hypothetical protein
VDELRLCHALFGRLLHLLDVIHQHYESSLLNLSHRLTSFVSGLDTPLFA